MRALGLCFISPAGLVGEAQMKRDVGKGGSLGFLWEGVAL